MFQHDRLNNELSFWQKVKALDYILLTSVFLLSIISLFVMYSTDGGEILYHTKSHFSKIIIFFPLMIFISFFNIKWWHNFSYIFYISCNSSINLCFFFWNKIFRFKKMDGFIFI